MILAAIPFVEWLATQTGTTSDDVELGLWISLLAGLLYATVQFITMMVTVPQVPMCDNMSTYTFPLTIFL